MRTAIGIDLGATRVRAGIVTEVGELVASVEAGIATQGPEQGLAILQDLIAELLHEQPPDLAGIGIGASGPIDRARGTVDNPYTLHGWSNVPLVERLQGRFGLPVQLDNDANVAALGEFWLGAGRGASRLYVVTVGTGVGTALIVRGALQRGLAEVHPEGGHQLIHTGGPLCYCGRRGCWESLIAGPSIARRARLAAETGGWRPAPADSGSRFEAPMLAQAAAGGDPFAQRIMQDVALDLARGLVNIILLLLPDVIVLSGGVMRSADVLLPTALEAIRSGEPLVPFNRVRIVAGELGDAAGLFGGARMILGDA